MEHEGKWLWTRIPTTAVVTVYERPIRYGYDITTKLSPQPVPMRYDLEPVAQGTRLTLSNEAATSGWMNLVIGCAGDDPMDEGELTGAWAGNDSGVYYIRQVGGCVWWFGTEVRNIELGTTGQRGFANVASGRIVGTHVDLEWADVPLGDTVNGGGLTFTYDAANDQLTLIDQRGGRIPFGGTVLTRIQPGATSSATPSATPTPRMTRAAMRRSRIGPLWHGPASRAYRAGEDTGIFNRAAMPPRAACGHGHGATNSARRMVARSTT